MEQRYTNLSIKQMIQQKNITSEVLCINTYLSSDSNSTDAFVSVISLCASTSDPLSDNRIPINCRRVFQGNKKRVTKKLSHPLF